MGSGIAGRTRRAGLGRVTRKGAEWAEGSGARDGGGSEAVLPLVAGRVVVRKKGHEHLEKQAWYKGTEPHRTKQL